MSKSMGPHLPKPGWQKRWVVQSAQLAMRAPLALLALLGCALLIGCVVLVAAGFLASVGPSPLGANVIIAMGALVALPARLLIGNLILAADGRGQRSLGEILEMTLSVLPLVLGVELAVVALDLVIGGTSARGAEASSLAAMGLAEVTLKVGISAMCHLEMALWIWSVMWVGTLPALHMGPGDALAADSALRHKSWTFWLAMMVIQFVVRGFVMTLPTLLGMGLLFFNFVWIYVAAREVIGGIDDNGIEETAAVPQAS